MVEVPKEFEDQDVEEIIQTLLSEVVQNDVAGFLDGMKATSKKWLCGELDSDKTLFLFEFVFHEIDRAYLNMFIRIFDEGSNPESSSLFEDDRGGINFAFKMGGYNSRDKTFYYNTWPIGCDTYELQYRAKQIWYHEGMEFHGIKGQ